MHLHDRQGKVMSEERKTQAVADFQMEGNRIVTYGTRTGIHCINVYKAASQDQVTHRMAGGQGKKSLATARMGVLVPRRQQPVSWYTQRHAH